MLEPVQAANRLLDQLRIVDHKDLQLLELIAHERNAIVVEEPLEGSEARLVVVGKKAVITVSSLDDNPQRKRFSIAHELGHLELHKDLGVFKLCQSDDINNWALRSAKPSREAQANEFAGALLLPERFFGSLCLDEDPSITHISNLAQMFNVSLTATAIRYTHFCTEPIAIVFSKKGFIDWYRANEEFSDLGLRVAVGRQLDEGSKAALYFRGQHISAGTKIMNARAWLYPGRYHRDTILHEQSIALPRYQAVLTLLWLEEELDDDNPD